MIRRLSAIALAIVACSGACMPTGGRTAVDPVPSGAEMDRRTRSAREASQRLRSGIDSARATEIAATLRQDVELISLEREAFRGREAVTSHLMQLAEAPRNRLRIYPGEMQLCIDGDVNEYGGAYTARPTPGAPLGPFQQGVLEVVWDVSGDSALAAFLDFSVAPTMRRASCEPLLATVATRRRWGGALGIMVNRTSPSAGILAVRDGMHDRSLAYDYRLFWRMAEGPGPFPRATSAPLGVHAGIRFRMTPVFTTEMQLTAGGLERAEGYNNVEERHVTVSSRPVVFAQLINAEYRGLRAGVGPAVLLSNFKVQDEHAAATWMTMEQFFRMSDNSTTRSSASPAFGAKAELAFSQPMGRRLLAEFRADYGAYGSGRVPGTPFFPEMHVSNSFATLSAMLGITW